MGGKKIKWGNVIVFLLIIAAAVAAYIYKNPGNYRDILNSNKIKVADSTDKSTQKDKPSKNSARNDMTSNNSAQSSDTASGNGASYTDEFIMGLDSWIGGTPALIALEREYNKDYSLTLKLKYIPNDEDRIVELKDGKIQATEMSLPAFIRFQEKYPGSGVIVGITDFSRGADGIVARSEVKNLNDMEGRKVSYVGDGTGKFILNKFLRLTGLRYQDIEPIEHKEMGEVVEDLKTGKADLIISWSPDMNVAVNEINAANPDSVKILITTKEVPNLVPTVLIVNRDVYDNYPDRVENFLKTWFASVKYITEKPGKAYDKLSRLMSERKDDYGEVTSDETKDSFQNIKLMSLNDNLEYFGFSGKEEALAAIIHDTIQTWKKYGDISTGDIPVENILSTEFMKRLKDTNDDEIQLSALDSSLTGNSSQASEVKQEFKKQDETSIDKNTEKVAKVDIPPVYYDSGKAAVKPESIPVLNDVVNILKQFPGYYLIIDANTDSVGSDETNLKLSKDRAGEVKKYLVSQGIDINRIVARGWGKYRPVVAEEKTEEDRAKNRRTEFVLTREVTGK